MKQGFVFPGQSAQFTGMGKSYYDNSAFSKKIFEQANEIIGFRLSDIMFSGSEEDLRETRVTQPAVFLHSIIAYRNIEGASPQMVAGHSLGEFTALVANGCLSFEDALKLVSIRAEAMQKACELQPSTMAAVLALADEKVEEICKEVSKELKDIVVAANYNCPGQLVISGSIPAVQLASERLKAAGAKRVLVLNVGGAFHSAFMAPAQAELSAAIESVKFHHPICPIYQNVVARAVYEPEDIKQNLKDQLTGPVRWTQLVKAMVADGGTTFTEVGPGKVLQGLIAKIAPTVEISGVS
ncbi:MAG: ACP S-malonyltransferase [Chitinophagaceae bacterium]|nr:ACP S-malonyltransferase [Chitinophagaceae bacterium]